MGTYMIIMDFTKKGTVEQALPRYTLQINLLFIWRNYIIVRRNKHNVIKKVILVVKCSILRRPQLTRFWTYGLSSYSTRKVPIRIRYLSQQLAAIVYILWRDEASAVTFITIFHYRITHASLIELIAYGTSLISFMMVLVEQGVRSSSIPCLTFECTSTVAIATSDLNQRGYNINIYHVRFSDRINCVRQFPWNDDG